MTVTGGSRLRAWVTTIVVLLSTSLSGFSSASMVWHGPQTVCADVAVTVAVNPDHTPTTQILDYHITAGHSHGPPADINGRAANGHTYYVLAGDTPVLVHNCGGSQPFGGRQCACANPSQGPGNAYSVAFETWLSPTSYPGLSRGAHFREANQNLLDAMNADSAFDDMMESMIPEIRNRIQGPGGRAVDESPADLGWTWHHHVDPGRMQLVPVGQHTARWSIPGAVPSWWPRRLCDLGLGGIMNLDDVVRSLADLPREAIIYVPRELRTVSPETPALLVMGEDSQPEGWRYFLEVLIAREVLDVWSSWRDGRTPSPEEALSAIAYYAEHDAYQPNE